MTFSSEAGDEYCATDGALPIALLAERFDRMRPATAGLVTGALGGASTLLATERLIRAGGGAGVIPLLGAAISHGALSGPHAMAAALAAAAVAGAILGACFATLTRHLRRFGPLLFWALVFFPAAWTLICAFAIPLGMPALPRLLPYVPTLIGTLVLALGVSLQVPLRVRRVAPG